MATKPDPALPDEIFGRLAIVMIRCSGGGDELIIIGETVAQGEKRGKMRKKTENRTHLINGLKGGF
jgi:hypothetical protein